LVSIENKKKMKKKEKKIYLQQKKRYVKKIVGTSEKPRLAVYRSHSHIYAQLIDDSHSSTLLSCSTLEKKELSNPRVRLLPEAYSPSTKIASKWVGEEIAIRAIERNIHTIVFDRGKKPYQGRIQSLAEGAREKGLLF
jgi:large subunit ribosomal protein L18